MKKYNVGVVGYGWVASAHIAAINATGQAAVTAVCSSRKLDPAELSARHGGSIRVYGELEEMLTDPEIHIVSICSMPSRHVREAVLAAKARKHLILEKPLALNARDLEQLVREVRAAGVSTCVCFECRYSSQFLATKAVIDQGLLGALHFGEVDYYHGIGPWYAQFRWNIRKSEGGSALLSAGCHALDALLLCMGSDVVEVFTYGASSADPQLAAYEYPSTSLTLLKFANGAVGKCAASIDCLQPYYFHTHLVGSKGSILDNRFHSTELKTSKDKWSTLAFKPLDSGDVSDHPYLSQFTAFFHALQQGTAMPLTDLEKGARTHQIIFAAEESLRTGRAVPVPPASTPLT